MKQKLTDAEIQNIVLDAVKDGASYYNDVLASEIESNIKYYLGEYPRPARGGTSKYVSQDVWDVVESLKAQMLETFSGNRIIVRFAPQGPDDVEPCRVATEVANYVYSRYNNGFLNTQAIIHNGLTARNGIAKVYWQQEIKEVEESFDSVPVDALTALLNAPDVDLTSLEDHGDGTVSGRIKRSYDASNVKVDPIAPECFIISKGATSKETAAVIGDRVLKTKDDLIREGYDKKKVERLGSKGEGVVTDIVKQARFGDLDADNPDAFQESAQEFWIYEIYLKLDKEGTGELKLYKVVTGETSGTMFSCEEVDSVPYFSFVPLPIPHSFYGANFVGRAAHIQNAKTTITRGILEHTVITNNPRFWVMKGGLKNPRELVDNRIGGIVNVTRPDAFGPVEQAPLNPFAFSVIEKLDADKEDNTGVSRLSKGLNKDAISKQNSAEMVGDLTSLSMTRQKMIARNFAEGFLRDVFLYIYELILKNAGPEYYAEVAGEYIKVDTTRWVERKAAIVEFTIGYQETEKQFQEEILIHQMLSADPTMAPLYTLDKKYNSVKRALETKGRRDINNYLTPLEQAQPPEPDPLMVAEIESKKMMAQAKMMEAQTNLLRAQNEIEIKKIELQIKQADLAARTAIAADKQDLDEQKFEHDREMDVFEASIVQRAEEQGNTTASANVNSSTG